MSAAMAQASDAAPAKKGGKKLIIIVVALVVVLALAGVAAMLLLKKNAAHDEEEGEEEAPVVQQHKPKKAEKGVPPTFLPLDTFTVNLADKGVERYAQVGVTLEVDGPEMAEQMKAYMPAIRSNVLMVLSHKTSEELLDRAGKEKLAKEIMRESVRPMGIELDDEEDEEEADDAPKKKKKRKKPAYNPVVHVHFSNFIIQ